MTLIICVILSSNAKIKSLFLCVSVLFRMGLSGTGFLSVCLFQSVSFCVCLPAESDRGRTHAQSVSCISTVWKTVCVSALWGVRPRYLQVLCNYDSAMEALRSQVVNIRSNLLQANWKAKVLCFAHKCLRYGTIVKLEFNTKYFPILIQYIAKSLSSLQTPASAHLQIL